MPKKPTHVIDPDPRNIHVDSEDKTPINAEAELDEIIRSDGESTTEEDEERSNASGRSND